MGFTKPLPAGVIAPIPPPTPWIGDVLEAAAYAGTGGEFVAGVRAEASAEQFGLEKDLPVVVVLADGLGLHQLLDKLGHAPTLRGLRSEPVRAQTVAPSTTSAALTTLATGRTPGATRMVGYSVRHGDGVMNLLQFAPGVSGREWQPEPTILERMTGRGIDCAIVTDPRFQDSGLTGAAMRGARFVGAQDLSARFGRAVGEVRRRTPLTYVYWSGIDKVGHGHGPNSHAWSAALEDFDMELRGLLSSVGDRAQVLLTADHGMVEVGERVDIAGVPFLAEGVELVTGEGRAAHIHASAGQAESVEQRWREYWGDRAWIFNRQQVPQVIGEGPGLELLGDLLVMPDGDAVVGDSRTQSQSALFMPGVHGSLTEVEMEIPVWRLC